ncbi:MAG: hypothetical protein ACKVJK_16870, partial [Methylophagaceae bacterium]
MSSVYSSFVTSETNVIRDNVGQIFIGNFTAASELSLREGYLFLNNDTTKPTVVFSHNASTTSTLNSGDSVTVTATFSEAMRATPTINITNQVVDIAMSSTSSAAIWTYNWVVDTSIVLSMTNEVSVTVSGTDLALNAYSGTDSLTFGLCLSTSVIEFTDNLTSQGVCYGSPIESVVVSFTNATGLAISPLTPLPSGLSLGLSSVSSSVYEISGVSTQQVTSTNSWTVLIESVGSVCQTTIASFTFNLIPPISSVGTITTSLSSICLGNVPYLIAGTEAIAPGTISYQWQSSISSSELFTDIVGATLQDYTPTIGITTDTFFRRLTRSTLYDVTCEDIGNVLAISVIPLPVPDLIASSNAIASTEAATITTCIGEEVTFNASGGSSFEFLLNGVLVGARADSNLYTATNLLEGDLVNVVVYDQPTSAAVSGCFATSESIVIAIAPVPNVTLSTSDNSEVHCEGDTITFIGNSSIEGSIFEFFVNGIAFQTGSDSSFNPTNYENTSILSGDVIELVASTGVVSCSNATASITILINSITSAGTIGTVSTTICSGELHPVLSPLTAASAVGSISYRWESGLDSQTFNIIPNTNSSTYILTEPLTQTTLFRRVTISTLTAEVCEAITNNVELIVVAPLDGGSITASQSIGIGSIPATLNGSVVTSTTSLIYQWQSGTDSATFINIPGASQQDYSPSALVTSTYFRRMVA